MGFVPSPCRPSPPPPQGLRGGGVGRGGGGGDVAGGARDAPRDPPRRPPPGGVPPGPAYAGARGVSHEEGGGGWWTSRAVFEGRWDLHGFGAHPMNIPEALKRGWPAGRSPDLLADPQGRNAPSSPPDPPSGCLVPFDHAGWPQRVRVAGAASGGRLPARPRIPATIMGAVRGAQMPLGIGFDLSSGIRIGPGRHHPPPPPIPIPVPTAQYFRQYFLRVAKRFDPLLPSPPPPRNWCPRVTGLRPRVRRRPRRRTPRRKGPTGRRARTRPTTGPAP